ncbi:MAG: hypothetical protein CSA62_07515 [Planctomycetota bacterium]|nr:MAG: hypothetical protein CSA62_07515 [Planctomycetota bacterium]
MVPGSDWARVLVAESDRQFLGQLEAELRKQGFSVDLSLRAEEARILLDTQRYEILLIDASLRLDEGQAFWQWTRESAACHPCLVLLPPELGEDPQEIIRGGADDVIELPIAAEEIPERIRIGLSRAREQRARIRLLRGAEELMEQGGPIGQSPSFRRLEEEIANRSLDQELVVLFGEPGAGKSLHARSLHRQSMGEFPFRREDCRKLQKHDLLGLETRNSSPGTLLLEHIGELDEPSQEFLVERLPSMQEKRLRVVMTRCPGEPPLIDDLARVTRGREVHVPPLRDRPGDIPLLATCFLDQSVDGFEHEGLSAEALALLCSMPWRSNVRQLRGTIREAVTEAKGRRVTAVDIEEACDRLGYKGEAEEGARRLQSLDGAGPTAPKVLPFEVEERKILVRALSATGGHVAEAAKLLKIGRATLYRKIQCFDIKRSESVDRHPPSPK